MSDLSSLRKRRGVAKASLTRLRKRVSDLEHDHSDGADDLDAAKQLLSKLESIDADFRTHHLSIVDLSEGDDLDTEQRTLDTHDDDVSKLSLQLHKIMVTCTTTSTTTTRKVSSKRLHHLLSSVNSISSNLSSLPYGADGVATLHHYAEQLAEFGREAADVRGVLYSLDLSESDELTVLQAEVEKILSVTSIESKRRLSIMTSATSHTAASGPLESRGVKLPRIEVPTFDGNLLHWMRFWEQFEVAVHNKTNLSEAEKLVYLQHALKGGAAKQAIEGLSSSSEHYTEAIQCLKDRYSGPRLIHQAHVRMIVEAAPLKDGTGRELRKLHDHVQQHLRALRSFDHDPPGAFITSLLELKLDQETMFEWQRHSQESKDIPHYDDLLKFLDLRAQASESSSDPERKSTRAGSNHSHIPRNHTGKRVSSFSATVVSSMNCVACKRERHPIYACSKFKALTHDERMTIIKSNSLCLNCLHPGHHAKECKSAHRCRHCQRPHHTWLHNTETRLPPGDALEESITHHATMDPMSHVLLMTCRVLVQAPDGTLVESRALLDSGSSASFVSERLVQSLSLPRTNGQLSFPA